MLTPELFAEIVECPIETGREWAGPIEAAMMEYGIMSRRRAAMFLAQMGTESDGFDRFTENMNYSTEGLLRTFKRHRITVQQAQQFGRNAAHPADQEALANILYGGAFGLDQLGNTEPGDGWRFRAHGPKGITGRYNFTALTRRLRERLGPHVPDFVANPALLTQPHWGSYSAGDFWDAHDLNTHADLGDVEDCTRIINGGSNGLADRQRRYENAMKVLE